MAKLYGRKNGGPDPNYWTKSWEPILQALEPWTAGPAPMDVVAEATPEASGEAVSGSWDVKAAKSGGNFFVGKKYLGMVKWEPFGGGSNNRIPGSHMQISWWSLLLGKAFPL